MEMKRTLIKKKNVTKKFKEYVNHPEIKQS
jgi:hypothetical protein